MAFDEGDIFEEEEVRVKAENWNHQNKASLLHKEQKQGHYKIAIQKKLPGLQAAVEILQERIREQFRLLLMWKLINNENGPALHLLP